MSNNLKRGNPETQFKAGREQAETARKGGIASGKARREKRDMKDTALIMLSMSLREGKIDNIENIKSIAELNGKNISTQSAIILKQILNALKGDSRAAEFVRDISGNKQKEGVELSGTVNNPFAGLTTEELKRLIDD